MAVSDAEREANRRRQQAWRARHQGKPRGNKVLMAELAALRKERDDLAERLAQIRSYQPGIEAEARAWLAKIGRASRAIGETDDWPENN